MWLYFEAERVNSKYQQFHSMFCRLRHRFGVRNKEYIRSIARRDTAPEYCQ